MVTRSEPEDAGHCSKPLKLFFTPIQKLGLCNCQGKEGIEEGQQGTLRKDAESLLINEK